MIVVFAGAGASAALTSTSNNEPTYPSTLGFLAHVTGSLTADYCFQTIIEHHQRHYPSNPPDIETVLSAIQNQKALLEQASDTSHLFGLFLATARSNFVKQGNKAYPDWNQTQKELREFNDLLAKLEVSINREIFTLYRTSPQPRQLTTNWIPLLQGLKEIDPHVEIVTTNYDLVIERAIRELGLDIKTGKVEDDVSTLDVGTWRPNMGGLHLLTKLHGSVHWTLNDDNQIVVGNTTWLGNTKRHIIIYPGIKQRSTEIPFGPMHDYFEGLLQHESLRGVIFIGYAFRDEVINGIVTNKKNRKVPIVDLNINPSAVFSANAT